MDIPDKVGKYKLLDELARGGMGVVFKAFDETLNRYHAAKMLPAEYFTNDAHRNRFELEARIVAKLDHPNIMKVYSIENTKDTVWIIMEYLEGILLIDKIKNEKKIPSKHCEKIIRQLSHALAYAHSKGIIHRDIKPANIMIQNDGTVKLMDFGIARDEEKDLNLTQDGTIIGTPKYMSPEQFSGESIDKRTDIYSLGVVAFEMVSGNIPFEGKTIAQIAYKHMHEKVPSLKKCAPNISNELKQFITSSLEKKKEKRLSSLDLALTNELGLNGNKKTKKAIRQYKVGLIALLIFIVSSGTYYFLRQQQKDEAIGKKTDVLKKEIQLLLKDKKTLEAKNKLAELNNLKPKDQSIQEYENKLKILETVLENKNKAINLFSKALKELENNNIEKFEGIVKECEELVPEYGYQEKSRTHLHEYKKRKSEKLFIKALKYLEEDNLKDYQIFLNKASRLFPEKQDVFQSKGEESIKNIAWRHYLKASKALKKDDIETFNSDLKKADKLNPQELYLNKGAILLKEYYAEQAEEHYKEAIRLALKNEFEKSNIELRKCLKLNSDHAKAYYQLSENFFEIKEGISKQYCTYLKKALTIIPDSSDSENMWRSLAQAFSELGDKKNALISCQEGLKYFPESRSLKNLEKIFKSK